MVLDLAHLRNPLGRRPTLRAQFTMRSRLAVQDRPQLEVDLVGGEKIGGRAERRKCFTAGQEVQVAGERQRSNHNANAGLRFPDFVAYYGALPQSARIGGARVEKALSVLVQPIPGTHELPYLDRRLKIVLGRRHNTVADRGC
jgi:hypothetical protein